MYVSLLSSQSKTELTADLDSAAVVDIIPEDEKDVIKVNTNTKPGEFPACLEYLF